MADTTRRPAPPRARSRPTHRRCGRICRPTDRSNSTNSAANSAPGSTRPTSARRSAAREPRLSPKPRPWHRDRRAVVSVRQSTPQQVLDHRASTARQYALADRAVVLGWPRDRVVTIDDDLGKSGPPIEGRPGFQRLLAEVARDPVGLIRGLEMSRLARSCKDWHQLLELCGRYRVLLADADGLYDPTEYSGRRRPGPHGVMSAAERHVLEQRRYQGQLNKARRGALLGTPPIGYLRLATGAGVIDPDEQVQAVVRLVFDQFDRGATLHGLLRYLVHHPIRIPVRVAGGPNEGQLEWRRPNRATRQDLLRPPSQAGAYRFGHRPTDPRQEPPGRPSTGKLIRRPAECLVLLRDRLPAYISWGRLAANQQRRAANRNLPSTPGAPRNGPALLAGLMRCGRGGRRMVVRCGGPRQSVSYTCTRGPADYGEPLCQGLSNAGTPAEPVAGQLPAAAQPAALEARPAAVAGVKQPRAESARQWQSRRERAAIAAGRAARQYQACEPESRLVARELERRWEAALQQKQRRDDEYDRLPRSAPAELSDTALSSIRALAADLPAVWPAATAAPADRPRIARLLLERVVVAVDKASERVEVTPHGVGGAARPHTITRPVARSSQPSDYQRLVARPRELCTGRRNSAAIAQQSNAAGFRPPKRTKQFTGERVRRLTVHLGLLRRQRHGSTIGLGPDEYRPMGLARRLGISRDTVRRWPRAGWLNLRRGGDGHPVVWAGADDLRRLRELHALPRTWATKKRLAELKQPKPRPAR